MERNKQLRDAWEFVEHTGTSVFLTGKAGTGKTTFLRTLVEKSSKRLVVVAPTGVAAINAGGVTIHSFFQLPLSPFVPGAQTKTKYAFSKEKQKIIASLDMLVIDEISMVRADLLDAVDSVLKRYRDRYLPFGGVQLVMIGDLQQLTPVVTPEDEAMLKPYYDTPYFFGSKALQSIEYVTIQLEKVYRQQDDQFIGLLNRIRVARPTPEDIELLNQRCNQHFMPDPKEGYIRLTTHNLTANRFNDSELQRLTTPPFTFDAQIEGTFPEYSYPTNPHLTLKENAQVMFVKIDPQGRYYNGLIGHIVQLDENHVRVKCTDNHLTIDVEPLSWENTHYKLNAETKEIEAEVQGTFTQFPLRLAWAITIHKSQGLTFQHAIIDACNSFAPGQVYVALSRCTSLEGLVLATPISQHVVINDQRVDNYIARQESEAQKSIGRLPELKEEYHRHLLLDMFDFQKIQYKEADMVRLMTEYFARSHSRLTELHRTTLDNLKKQVLEVAFKWTQQIGQMTTEQLHTPQFADRVTNGSNYFAQLLEELFTKPLQLTKDVKTNNKQAMARLTSLLDELQQAVLSKHKTLCRVAETGFSVNNYLKEKNYSLLEVMDGQKGLKPGKARKEKKPKPPKEPKEKTYNTTLRLYLQGLSPLQIATARSLTIGTIYNHLARFVNSGDINLLDILPQQHIEAIQRVVRMVGTEGNTTAIKALCPPEVTYDEIRLVLSTMK